MVRTRSRNGSTTRWRKVRLQALTRDRSNQSPCWICGLHLDYTLTEGADCWEPDHYWPVSTHPHLEHDIANLRPSHHRCNRNRGNTHPNIIIERAIGLRSRDW